MSEQEVWEIDFDKVTLGDLMILEEGAAAIPKGDFSVIRKVCALLGRLVINKTVEEIEAIPLGELWDCLDAVGEGIQDVIPKAKDTPS